MKPGTLIKDKYENMELDRPYPWIGMPVAYYGQWFLVTLVNSAGFAAITKGGTQLSSYRFKKSRFILPGEPDAPPMSEEFRKKLLLSYTWGISIAIRDGKWVEVYSTPAFDQVHTVLRIPHGLNISDAFPVSAESPKVIKNLKLLNTDGRKTCAQCGADLRINFFGMSNFSYCPVCEP